MPKIGNEIMIKSQNGSPYFFSFFTICDAVNNNNKPYAKIAIAISIELIFPIRLFYWSKYNIFFKLNGINFIQA